MEYDIESFDRTTPKGLLAHAKKLCGKTFADVIAKALRGELSVAEITTSEDWKTFEDKARKGGLGNLLEEVYFGYKPNSDSRPDFPEAGVELKVTPYEKSKSGEKLRAGERLVLSMIPHDKPIDAEFLEESHLWEKCEKLLLIFYLREAEIDKLLYRIDYASLFTPPEADLIIIRQDFLFITKKIKAGLAHELSEGDTIYLGAATKGADAKSSLKSQYYNANVLAPRRAWTYKQPYMSYVLRTYVCREDSDTGEIFSQKNLPLLRSVGFSESLQRIVQPYLGKTKSQLSAYFGIDLKKGEPKNLFNILATRMLTGCKDSAVEFRKAGIKVKTIRIESNGKMKEHFRLFDVDFEEHANATSFEESALGEFLEATQFYLVIFQSNGKEYVFKGAFLWNMPFEDRKIAGEDFSEAQGIIQAGIQFEIKQTKSGPKVLNNLPKPEETQIVHIRTHAAQSYYVFADERGRVGKGTLSNTIPVPNTNHRCTKHSYWFNKDYVLSVIRKHLPKVLKKK